MDIISKSEKAFILLSGGQDSFVCLLWAMKNFKEVEAVTIDYGQSHSIEMEYAKRISGHFKITHVQYDIGNFLKCIAESSLLNNSDHNKGHSSAKHLPASFVPNRNGLFLTIISNHAYKQNVSHIHLVTGTCETDFSGYPDCRDNYIKTKQLELSLGLDIPVTIHTPLMWSSKAETFILANNAGKLSELINLTLTCYNGIEEVNEWGRGCRECPACRLRKKGYDEFMKQMQKACP